MFKLNVFQARRYDRWSPQPRYGDLIDAMWEFADGVKVHYRDNTTWRESGKKSRVYVWCDEQFNLLEDLENRTRRPHTAWRAPTIEALARIGVTGKLNWSQYAGCSCPCSPGFILTGGPVGGDFWVTLPGAPAIDVTKDARNVLVTS